MGLNLRLPIIAEAAPMMNALVVSLALTATASSATLPTATPESVGLRSERLDQIGELAQEGLQRKRMPGCVVMIGRHGKIVYHEAFGHRQLQPELLPMQKDTVFDMASITKPVATATSIMILVEQGRIRLRDRVTTYVPEFGNSGKEQITVTQLLTHQAGFIPDNSIRDYDQGREQAFQNIYKLKTTYDPGTKFVYSDVGFVLLDDLIERQSGQNVHQFSQKQIFEPLAMTETGYVPPEELRARAAPTEQRDGEWIRGEVHDPRAYRMAGIAGHAGLFSTANDLAIYAQMMLNGGHYSGKRILSKQSVDLMTSAFRIAEGKKVSIRGLGWDKLTGYSSNRGENMSDQAFGHGGFTGTVLWIDPELDLFFIFLSNRVHPNGKGYVNRLAGRMATVAVGAIDDELLTIDTATDAAGVSTRVALGIDRLVADDFRQIRDQRIGLITNQTGISSQGTSTIKLLHRSPHVDLAALFSPEHGLAGKLDQSIVGDSVDQGSGIKVFSLYGQTRKPTAEQLSQVDTLVFDIQDIGCRFYTYISTMGLAMEAAAEHGKRFVVLDRPNPINGVDVSGPMRDADQASFVAFHDLPIRHGMTVGELSQMFQAERKLDTLKLDIIACEGWIRQQYLDETGLLWINPSPNMRNLNEAILYPGIGMWETTNISVGRGTDNPFEVVGAPWISAQELATELNRAQLPGVRFTPKQFVPNSSKYKNAICGGVHILITNRESFDPLQLGIQLGCSLQRLYGVNWKLEDARRLVCHQETLNRIESGMAASAILLEQARDLNSFRNRRNRFLIY